MVQFLQGDRKFSISQSTMTVPATFDQCERAFMEQICALWQKTVLWYWSQEKQRDHLLKTGIWMPDVGVNYTRTAAEGEAQIVEKLQNKTLRVTTTTVRKFSSILLFAKLVSISTKRLLNFSCFRSPTN